MPETVYKTEQGRKILLDYYDEILAKWSFPFSTAMADTRFGSTHVILAGDRGNPALVLLHGAASNALGWGGLIPLFSKDHYVIAPDMPGDPGKSQPTRPSWGNDDCCTWLEDVLAALNIRQTSLLGISFGGWLAARFASLHPDRVNRLILLAPGGLAPARTSAILKTICYSLQKQKGAEKLKRMVFGGGEIQPDVSRFFVLLQMHYQPRFGSPKLLRDDELRKIQCPVLMVAGGEDAFFDAGRSAARLKALLPAAEVIVNANGKHGSMDDSQRILSFLSDS